MAPTLERIGSLLAPDPAWEEQKKGSLLSLVPRVQGASFGESLGLRSAISVHVRPRAYVASSPYTSANRALDLCTVGRSGSSPLRPFRRETSFILRSPEPVLGGFGLPGAKALIESHRSASRVITRVSAASLQTSVMLRSQGLGQTILVVTGCNMHFP